MKRINFFLLGCFNSLSIALNVSAQQVIPDNSLGIESSTIQNQIINSVPSEIINGGARRESALFHSFSSFSVATGQGAYFTNPSGITDILARVTGRASSFIDGVVGVVGPANLFLINPNGVIFGPNARLDIRGSFLASTASRIDFQGFSFDAIAPNSPPPLLTNNVPVGLGFTGQPASISVQGSGHSLSLLTEPSQLNFNNPFANAGLSPVGLRIDPGRTIALVGGTVSFNGGVLTAPSGNIQIGGVQTGEVQLIPTSQGWNLDYSNAVLNQPLQFQRRSLLDVSGSGGGQISVFGGNISLSDGTFFLNQSLVARPNRITIQALDLNLSGTNLPPIIQQSSDILESKAGIFSYTLFGQGADIDITAKNLNLIDGGMIRTITFGEGAAGNITAKITNETRIEGVSPLDPLTGISAIFSQGFSTGRTGNILLRTNNLILNKGGNISTGTFSPFPSSGSSGNITVDSQFTQIDGIAAGLSIPSVITTYSSGAGLAGNLDLSTKQLRVTNGGALGSVAFSIGSPGNVTIKASDIIVTGGPESQQFSNGIGSAAFNIFPALGQTFGLAPVSATEETGNVTITTNRLQVKEFGQINISNFGLGKAGTLKINANLIELNQGTLRAETISGQGGDIQLKVGKSLVLRNSSEITATAREFSNSGNIAIDSRIIILRGGSSIRANAGQGFGGNIVINSQLVAAIEGSRISANASKGAGGQIIITTQGIFQSPDTFITATSELGPQFNGIVQINTPDIDLSRSGIQAVPPPEAPEVAVICGGGSTANANSFTVSGTGGIPINPNEFLGSQEGWQDPDQQTITASSAVQPDQQQIVEAQGWERTSPTTVRFMVRPNSANTSRLDTISAHCHTKTSKSMK